MKSLSDLLSPAMYTEAITQITHEAQTIMKLIMDSFRQHLSVMGITADIARTMKHLTITCRIYSLNDSFIIGRIISSRVIKAMMQMQRCTIKTEAGLPPIFSTMYEIGTMVSKIPPITDWYRFTLPVAAADTMSGFATESTTVIHSMIRRKVTLFSGMLLSQIERMVSVPSSMGKDRHSNKKKVNFELLNMSWCMYP